MFFFHLLEQTKDAIKKARMKASRTPFLPKESEEFGWFGELFSGLGKNFWSSNFMIELKKD